MGLPLRRSPRLLLRSSFVLTCPTFSFSPIPSTCLHPTHTNLPVLLHVLFLSLDDSKAPSILPKKRFSPEAVGKTGFSHAPDVVTWPGQLDKQAKGRGQVILHCLWCCLKSREPSGQHQPVPSCKSSPDSSVPAGALGPERRGRTCGSSWWRRVAMDAMDCPAATMLIGWCQRASRCLQP